MVVLPFLMSDKSGVPLVGLQVPVIPAGNLTNQAPLIIITKMLTPVN